ncbi:MAG: transposase [Lachnospiraceae bacterium]|nr:transposase [Lachnospiraceae bacterium]
MADRIKNLEKSWESRKEAAKDRALKEIRLMQAEKVPINFNSVHVRSGLSKNYLYQEPELRKVIEECRKFEGELKKNVQEKYDKTSKSKDVIIEAKNRRIAKLEEENRRLRSEVELLRGMLYDRK